MNQLVDKLSWDDLRYFVSTANTSSLRLSAQNLGISTATLSRHLITLEENLSSVLFLRKTTGLELTAAGVALFEQCKKIQAVIAEIGHDVNNEQAEQEVRLASIPCIAHYKVIPAMASFNARCPSLKLIVNTSPELSELSDSNVDIALRLSRPQSGRFLIRRLSQFSLSAFQAHNTNFHKTETPPVILWGSFHGYTSRINEMLINQFPNHRIALMSNNLFNIIQGVRSGLGISILPDYVACHFPDLEKVDNVADLPNQDVWMVIREEAQRRAAVRNLADYIAESVPHPMIN